MPNLNALAVADNGSIYAAGAVRSATAPGSGAIVKYTPTGQVDTSFGTSGVVSIGASMAWDVVLNNGQITVGAGGFLYEGHNADAQVWRFDAATGAPVSSFGNGGMLTATTLNYDPSKPFAGPLFVDVEVDGQNRVVGTAFAPALAGPGSGLAPTVFRVNTNGTKDASYGGTGTAGRVDSLDLLPDGRAALVASIGDKANLVLLDSSGQVEKVTALPGNAMASYALPFGGVTHLPDGKLLATYSTFDEAPTSPYDIKPAVTVARFNADGTLDTTFGTNGMIAARDIAGVGYSMPSGNPRLDSQNRLVVPGTASSQGMASGLGGWAVLRFDKVATPAAPADPFQAFFMMILRWFLSLFGIFI